MDVTASNPGDYAAQSAILTFAAGESSKTFSVFITDDIVAEANETFSLILSDVSNGLLGSPATATVSIVDNDKARGRNRLQLSQNGRLKKRVLLER